MTSKYSEKGLERPPVKTGEKAKTDPTPPAVQRLMERLDRIAAHIDNTFVEQGNAARARLASVLAKGKDIREAVEGFAKEHRPWLQELARKISLADLDHAPALHPHRERIARVLDELFFLLQNVPLQLQAADRRAAELTGREPNLEEIEAQIRHAVLSVRNVHSETLPPLLKRLVWMVDQLDEEPEFQRIVTQLSPVGGPPPGPEPGDASHAKTHFARVARVAR